MSFYVARSEEESFEGLQQGDILENVPFCAVDMTNSLIVDEATDGGGTLRKVDFTASGSIDAGNVVVGYRLKPAIVVSQSCDLERGKHPIIVAPIRRFQDEFSETSIGSSGFKQKIKLLGNCGKAPTSFPLPPGTFKEFALPYSLVVLLEMQSMEMRNRDALERSVRLRLTPAALSKFQERIGYLFGRVAVDETLFFDPLHHPQF